MRLPRRLLATVLVAALVSAGCTGSSEKTEVLEATAATAVTASTATPTATVVPAVPPTPTAMLGTAPSIPPSTPSTPAPTPEPAETAVGPGGAGLLESLPLSPDATLGITGSPTLGGRSFVGYGTVYSGAEGEQASPQPTFWAPIGTKVLAPVTGTVVAIPVLWSGDFSVIISASGSSAWRWEAEHVIDVSVVVGDHVTAGQSIAIVSDYDERNTPGIGLVELGLLEGGNPPRHHCPFLYIAPALEVEILNQVRGMLEENAARLSLPVVDIAAPAVPGCVTTEPIEG